MDLNFEKDFWDRSTLVAGIDEVGRGCLAGPVVTAAIVFDPSHIAIPGVNDSKKLSPKKREELYPKILDAALDFCISLVPAHEVDSLGINGAVKKAMLDSAGGIQPTVHFLVDAVSLGEEFPHTSIIKGDAKVYSIAAASIIAKVFRDRLLVGLADVYPGYGFESHKGYGAKTHYDAIYKLGFTPEHRASFLRNVQL
jgi:ribonuclease HII